MPPKPFKAPRPSASAKTSSGSSSKGKAKAAASRKTSAARASGSSSFARATNVEDSEDDPFASIGNEKEEDDDAGEGGEEDVVVMDDEEEEEEERKERIPPELLTRLLHECFTNEKTRLSREANKAVGRYMETFVREALARAAFMRAEADAGGKGDGFLEVEDLEKLAPQLLLDF
ncbi:hypothetical protein M430DRAFT_21225 [Amorphotheca resinae ATCC 22711]|uniref:Centromere protein X n=1 Tax=Amorphotheca resinae ATCC 22711 TaxID=857342 RepID=A0A2T3AXG2_AMORE|nr:hypothetical protein M430DRAFT_21225 [Amorphotheca resinae ATCC 22711]PSS13320.1 hypothetical protein M430DRAFT_21225 [Amorphotheca resinae ATCC 22711]